MRVRVDRNKARADLKRCRELSLISIGICLPAAVIDGTDILLGFGFAPVIALGWLTGIAIDLASLLLRRLHGRWCATNHSERPHLLHEAGKTVLSSVLRNIA